jgi:hypothetical protein
MNRPAHLLLWLALASSGVWAQGAAGRPRASQPGPTGAVLGPAKDGECPQAWCPPCPQPSCPEEPFFAALLRVFEPAPPEVRVLAIQDLALLGDPRALNPLAQLVVDLNPAVQRAAIAAISKFRAERAEEILANVVRHPTLTDALKLRAIDALPFQDPTRARGLLEEIAHEPRHGYNLRTAAQKALQRLPPATP